MPYRQTTMAKDFKTRHPERKGSGLLVGLIVGFLLGMGTAAVIAIYVFKTPMPFASKAPATPAKPGEKGQSESKAAKGEEGKPRFDFYRILPGQEEPVTDRQLKDAAKQPAAGVPGSADGTKDIYFIQAGAFQNPAEADNRKAQLALLGLEASVEPTTVPEKGTWYRVRLGPFSRVEEINRVRAQLAQNGIDGSLVKVREPGQKN
jgi:cell division protein FtsN